MVRKTTGKGTFKRWAAGVLAGTAIFAATIPAYADMTAETGGKGCQNGAIEKLIEDGTISQSTSDTIEAYMAANPSEKQVSTADGSGSRTSMWESMLSAGVVTQEEYNSIIAIMPQRTAKEAADSVQ